MFTPEEKLIYTCPITNRVFDPLALKAQLAQESNHQFNTWVSKKDHASLEALAIKVFGGDQALRALTAFTRWLSGKGPRGQTSPTTAPSSVGPQVGSSPTNTSLC